MDRRSDLGLLLILLSISICMGCHTTSHAPQTATAESAIINLRAITGSGRMQMFTAVEEVGLLPKAVVDQLGRIASRGQAFNVTDVVDRALPSKQLTAAALSTQYCIVSYWQGGIVVRFKTAVFELSDARARLIWLSQGQGGLNFLDLKKMVESGRMRNALLPHNSGTI